MVLRLSLMAVAVLTACNAGGSGFRGVPPAQQEVAQSRFLLRTRGPVTEVTRVSPEFLPRFEDVARKAAVAVHRETGCVARWIVGDPAVLTIGSDCAGRPAPPMPKARPRLICDATDGYYSRATGLLDLTLDCTLE